VPIQVTCPSCRGTFAAPDTAAGKRAKCPTCGSVIQIPAADIEEILDAEAVPATTYAAEGFPAAASSAEVAGGERRPCPMCGEMIQKSALKCRFCGHVFDSVLAQAERSRGPGPVPGETVEEAAKRLIAEKYDKTTSIQIFVTSLLGCFSPIVFIYGIIFLLRRPYSFPYKGLAIAGTVIHGIWTLLIVASLVISGLQQ
jgi:predicted RNA-binding Zn-ribbon protein involved in translation (DUF1610 family)